MALATRCPNCDALFRVVSDQLKLRGGLVRCGACRHVFDAIGSLSYVEDTTLSSAAVPTPEDARAGAAEAPPPPVPSAEAPDPQPGPPAPIEVAAPAEPPQAPDPLAVPTLLAPGVARQHDGQPADPLDRLTAVAADRAARRRDASGRSARQSAAEAAEPDEETEALVEAAFLRQGRRPRWIGALLATGSLALALLLAAQLAVLYRTELVTRWPALRPALAELCAAAGCTLNWPTRADLIAVIGTELQALPGTDVLELTAVLRNRASFRVALPALELTLTDAANRILVRKVFAPGDYLAAAGESSQRLADGLGAGSDYVARLSLEARGLAAASYVVYPFYP